MKNLPALPSVPPCFAPPFRAVLRDVLARGGRFAGDRVETGRARRKALSQSGTFVGHRRYTRGDDLRAIDWAAYARSGELFVKQLEEEERRTATMLLDLSPSMLVGATARRFFAWRLAAVVSGRALQQLDALTVVAPGGGSRAVAGFTGEGDLDRLLSHLEMLPVATADAQQAIGLLLQRGVAGRVHWVSDFADPAACEIVLAATRRRGGRITGWLPAIAEDSLVPRRGFLRVADPETGDIVPIVVDAELAAAVQHELETLRRRQDRLFAQYGCPLVRWTVPAADDVRSLAYQELVGLCSR